MSEREEFSAAETIQTAAAVVQAVAAVAAVPVIAKAITDASDKDKTSGQ